MRLIIKYTKEERVKYISHLDFLRLVQRAIRRADIPVAYSQGFNPHPRLSFASALAVGVTSEGEYLDIFLRDDMDPELLCNRMNQKLPLGIRFVEGRIVDENYLPNESYRKGGYAITLSGDASEDSFPHIEEFQSQQEILVVRTNRKGSRQII